MTPMDTITFDKLPEAVSRILNEIENIKQTLELLSVPEVKYRMPIGIEDAAAILRKSKSTVYKLVNQKKIPCYKAGKQLYFYEDELIQWIEKGRFKTTASTMVEIAELMGKHARKRK